MSCLVVRYVDSVYVVGDFSCGQLFLIRKTHRPAAAPPEIRRNSAIDFFLSRVINRTNAMKRKAEKQQSSGKYLLIASLCTLC